MCFKELFKKNSPPVQIVPPDPVALPDPVSPPEPVEDQVAPEPPLPERKKGVIMLVKDPVTNKEFNVKDEKVDVLNLKMETKVVAFHVAQLITKEVGIEAVITNAKRSVAEQRAAMENLKKKFGRDYYDQVYGKWERSGGKIEELPHVEGRAVDFRYAQFQKAIQALQVLNDQYLMKAHFVIGYTPSSLVVIEKDNCFHIQTARGITDLNRPAYIDLVRTLASRA